MQHRQFYIGLEFYRDGRTWPCTDVGTRTVAAIRVDGLIQTIKHADGRIEHIKLTREEAEGDGWFSGPPYAVAERVFDEDDFDGCSLGPQGNGLDEISAQPHADYRAGDGACRLLLPVSDVGPLGQMRMLLYIWHRPVPE